MPMKYILTAMFFPEECALQLTGYAGRQQELQCRHDMTSAAYSESPIPSKANKLAWGFRHGDSVSPRSNDFLFKQATSAWKQVILDLQSTYVVDWVDWWPEQTARVPTDWFMDISLDGETYIRALAMSQFNGGSQAGYVVNAACTMENSQMTLLPIKARFLRICFNEASRVNTEAEWAVEVKLALEDKHQTAPHIQPLPDTTLPVWPSSDSLALDPLLFAPFVR